MKSLRTFAYNHTHMTHNLTPALASPNQTLTAELVHQTQNHRFYKLSQPIRYGFGQFSRARIDLAEELTVMLARVKPEWKDHIPSESITLVCVSDAHTHSERLVFGAVEASGRYGRMTLCIDGVTTMMIDRGDPSTMKPDRVYLRRLAALNGYQFIQ